MHERPPWNRPGTPRPCAKGGLDEGKRLGIIEGKRETLRGALRDMCDLLGLVLSPEQQAAMDVMDLAQLEDLRLHLKQHRAWPAPK